MSARAPSVHSRARRVGRLAALVALACALSYASAVIAWAADDGLIVPVRGVRSERLVSTFGAPRDGGRRSHEGVDIFAPRGTFVVAAGSGVVVYMGVLALGGNVVVTLGPGDALLYYAHLDRWAEGLRVGQFVSQGDVLGYVGNTGNARTTRPHLHFEVRPLARLLRAVDPVRVLRRNRRPPR